MISKRNRLDKKAFDFVFKNGSVVHSPVFMFKYVKSLDNKGYFSFVAPKTVAKSAVKRNFLRRKGYNALKNKDFLPISGIFVYKKGLDFPISSEDVSKSIDIVFDKIPK